MSATRKVREGEWGYRWKGGWESLLWGEQLTATMGDYFLVEEEDHLLETPDSLVAHRTTGWPDDDSLVGFKYFVNKVLTPEVPRHKGFRGKREIVYEAGRKWPSLRTQKLRTKALREMGWTEMGYKGVILDAYLRQVDRRSRFMARPGGIMGGDQGQGLGQGY